MPLNIRTQWNAGTACVSECVLKTLACRGLRVGPSKGLFPHVTWEAQFAISGAYALGFQNFTTSLPTTRRRRRSLFLISFVAVWSLGPRGIQASFHPLLLKRTSQSLVGSSPYATPQSRQMNRGLKLSNRRRVSLHVVHERTIATFWNVKSSWCFLNSASPKASHKRGFTLICWQPGSANTGSCSKVAISSCSFSFSPSIARTPFCAMSWRSPIHDHHEIIAQKLFIRSYSCAILCEENYKTIT